jgi:hypothetical protein
LHRINQQQPGFLRTDMGVHNSHIKRYRTLLGRLHPSVVTWVERRGYTGLLQATRVKLEELLV